MAENIADRLKQIEAQLSKIETGYANLIRTYYTLYLSSTPTDVEVEMYDEDGSIKKVTIPNLAKSRNNATEGYSDPEGNVVATTGALYINGTTGGLWYKTTPDGSEGWRLIFSDVNWIEGIDYIAPTGDGSGLTNLSANAIKSGCLPVKFGGTGLNNIEKGRLLKGNGINSIEYAEEGKDYLEPSSLISMIVFLPISDDVPNGFLKCDGSDISVEDYSNLFEKIGDRFNTEEDKHDSHFYNNGEAIRFRVPNLDGVFIRCWCGTENSLDTEENRELMSYQEDAIPNITASWAQEITGAEENFTGAVYIATDEDENYEKVEGRTSAPAGSYDYLIKFDASRNSGVYKNDVTEVRVRNIALMPVIRF